MNMLIVMNYLSQKEVYFPHSPPQVDYYTELN